MRTDFIIRAIEASVFLAKSNLTFQSNKEVVLSTAQNLMEQCWQTEYKSYVKGTEQDETLKFWSEIHHRLRGTVYYCRIILDETINPPGEQGNVEIRVQVNNGVEEFVFRLKGLPKINVEKP